MLVGFFHAITNAFQFIWGAVTNLAMTAITRVAKDVTGSTKDVTGIRKELVELKVAQIKVEEHESHLQRATLADVKAYDPKYKKLDNKIGQSGPAFDGFVETVVHRQIQYHVGRSDRYVIVTLRSHEGASLVASSVEISEPTGNCIAVSPFLIGTAFEQLCQKTADYLGVQLVEVIRKEMIPDGWPTFHKR